MNVETKMRLRSALGAALLSLMLGGCYSLGAAGPRTGDVRDSQDATYDNADIEIVELNHAATQRIASFSQSQTFAEIFGNAQMAAPLIERGDLIDVTIFEAPPAVLFGTTASGARLTEDPMLAANASIPQQRVDEDGTISLPFVGSLGVAGRSPAQVQRDIVSRLRGRAHDPQAIVRLVENNASNVTILGDVAKTLRVPLTTRGERLLDILAEAGGPTEDVDKTTIRLARGITATTMALETIILDPSQNVPVQTGDVVTVIHQPYSFIALGAVQQSAEIPFEGSGLSLSQALGRVGGLRDDRADVRGVFIFRFEDPDALSAETLADARTTQEGKVPVIYRLDLSDASSFFVAQDFTMRDSDILYISSAPGADLQKFLSALSNAALSTIAIGNSL
ncbi:capsular polysaccharide biosynthesis protein [Aurantiacibacter atlanticus]|uniref:Capsular polysaccharide biosynthesis protein n=1 Tax=Aurantiacibacter atlanticus TaxID=1648404 RepID=A0A0H4VJH2_9SPHN|nr:polysaccharide biosynthesis/export family protein [Aurantiacibacter atlanticus]AKQ43134.2 capsular polysaccharide biosynthesis protein [Aurantiacibacter atlanticus]MDF1836190.1 polysaccharide export protein [Alteraurantiacibacter sp. bin_em_oilr2.035]